MPNARTQAAIRNVRIRLDGASFECLIKKESSRMETFLLIRLASSGNKSSRERGATKKIEGRL